MKPDVLEFGCGCFDTPQHPPTSNEGDVTGCKGIGEPVAWSGNSRCSGEWDVEELNLEGVFERCRSLSSCNAPEDLLHEAVKMWW